MLFELMFITFPLMLNGKVPLLAAALKPGEKPYLIARVGINQGVLLQAAASAVGCVEIGSGGPLRNFRRFYKHRDSKRYPGPPSQRGVNTPTGLGS